MFSLFDSISPFKGYYFSKAILSGEQHWISLSHRYREKEIHPFHKDITGWNDKTVVQKKTTLQLYFKTFIDKINSGNLIMNCSWHEYSADGSDQAGFGVVGGHVGDVLDVWPNEVYQRVQVGGEAGLVREGYNVVALLLKPSLGLFGLVGRRRVQLPHPGFATGHLIAPGGSPHTSAHPGTRWCLLSSRLRRHEVAWCGSHLKLYQRP